VMGCRESVPQVFDVTNQQVAAAIGEHERVERRSPFDLEPPMAGHWCFPKRFGGQGAERLYSPYTCFILRFQAQRRCDLGPPRP
jgi:hypothetical protein